MKRVVTVAALAVLAVVVTAAPPLTAEDDILRPLGMGGLSRLSKARTRSISPENLTGEKGKGGMATEGTGATAARDLGRGWKVSPSVKIRPGQTFTMGEIQGEGVVQDYAAAGDWLRKAGVRVGGVDFPDSYNLGYAYTWLRLTKREMASVKELATLGARGTADVEFDPRPAPTIENELRRTELRQAVVNSTLLRFWRWNYLNPGHEFRTLEGLKRVPADPAPTFAFAHVLLPHPPFYLDASCHPVAHPITSDQEDGSPAQRAAALAGSRLAETWGGIRARLGTAALPSATRVLRNSRWPTAREAISS